MPRATWIQTNFNGGEWSPWAYGRVDLDKYKNSLALSLNFLATQQGALTRRSGTRYSAAVKDSTYAPRLQEFEFSTTQAYVLELGAGYIRFFTNDGPLYTSSVAAYNGGTAYAVGDLCKSGGIVYYCIKASTGNAPPNATYWYAQSAVPAGATGDSIYEIPTAFSITDVWALNFTQSADTLYIASANYSPMKLLRYGATNWQIQTISFLDGPYLPINSTGTTLTPGGVTGTVTVTASSTTGINGNAGFRASDVGRQLRIKIGANWYWGTIASYTDPTHITWTVASLSGSVPAYAATGVANVSGGGLYSITVTDGGAGYVSPPTITFGAPGAGAIAWAKLTNGSVSSVTVANAGSGYSGFPSLPSVTFAAPAASVPVAASYLWRMGLWNATDGYPTTTVFFQDRLCWAGAKNTPGRVDGSNTGDYENMAPSNIDGLVTDSSAISFTLNSAQANAIAWVVPDENGLLVGTSGGEWIVAPSGSQQALTFSNVNAKPMSQFGSTANVVPLKVGKATLFVQRTGRKLRELFYQFTYNTFEAVDLSILAEHLTQSGLKQLCLQGSPQQIVWVVRNDGRLVGMTYEKENKIVGWHQHTLGGFSDSGATVQAKVESIACIPSPGTKRDELWMVVQRYINGATVRYIEVMAKLWEDGDATKDCCFLDSSAAYTGAATTTISGLTWLKGQTVGVLTDGAVHPDCVVSSSGTISLNWSATTVQVGLKYTSEGRTLPVEAGGADGPAQGKLKRIVRTVMRFFQSIGVEMGSSVQGVGAYPQPWRTSADPMDGPVALFDGDKRWSYDSTWDTEGSVYFRTSDPLPCNITLLTAQLETNDAT